MIYQFKKIKLVGEFIKKKRQARRLSQKSLSLMFRPTVSTQFISNLERGVTPLPPIHIPILAKLLGSTELEIMSLLEQEYALKLNGRLGRLSETSIDSSHIENHHTRQSSKLNTLALEIVNYDYDFIKILYEAIQAADSKTRQTFALACENILKLPKSSVGPSH